MIPSKHESDDWILWLLGGLLLLLILSCGGCRLEYSIHSHPTKAAK
jgi:hypothetical protein